MNPEECTRCGKCCLNMRPYITVEKRSPDGRVTGICNLSRESFEAVVADCDLRRLYDRCFSFRYPKACPFLTQIEEGSFSCIIYEKRPVHCRNFSCVDKNKKKE